MATKAKVNESVYAKFLNKLSRGEQIVIRNVITGEVMFHLGNKNYFLGCQQTLNVSQLVSLRDLKLATSLHDLVRSGRISIE